MKKLMSAFLTLAVLLSMAACSSQSPAEGAASTEAVSSAAGEPDPEENSSQTASGATVLSCDLEGHEITTELFARKKLTMVNVWATFCGPCINEMPELGELSEEYADKDVQIVGVVSDVVASDGSLSEEQMQLAFQIVEKTGAGYLHLLPTYELYQFLSPIQESSVVPTTIFVDKDGKPVGEIVLGSNSKQDWIKIIDGRLKQLQEAE